MLTELRFKFIMLSIKFVVIYCHMLQTVIILQNFYAKFCKSGGVVKILLQWYLQIKLHLTFF